MKGTGAIIAAAVAALLLSAGAAFPRVIDGVVALVNGEPITFSEVRESVSEGMGIPVGDADALLREERDPAPVLRWIGSGGSPFVFGLCFPRTCKIA